MTRRIPLAHLAFILATFSVAGCSSDDSEGSGSGGTTAKGGAGGTTNTGGAAGSGGAAGGTGGAWACVGSVSYPMAPAATLDITKGFFHLSNRNDPFDDVPFVGATVDACDKGSDCATPSDTAR